MTDRIRILKHEAVPMCGRYEVRLSGGRELMFFSWDDLPSRRLRPDILTGEEALERAKAFARAERDKLL